MAKEIKFTEEELKSLSDLAQGYQTTQAAFGQLRVQKILLQQQSEGLEEAEIKLEADYTSLQDNERDIVKQLNEKYGPGSLDPQTGVFTPVESNEEKAEES
tara:strand:- start:226 stop:528 length:303 start_codon:yes stop_codon:yes gene_type:complete